MDRASKARFYYTNQDIFLRYFDSEEQYSALIAAGNFKKIELMIKESSNFRIEDFIKELETNAK